MSTSTEAVPNKAPLTRYLLLAGFVAFVLLLGAGLRLNPREVPSPLINKPAPAFSLPQLHEPQKIFSPAEMRGRVWMLNVWASWCVSCRQEHPLLMDLARAGVLPIYGLNYKDARDAGIAWLNQFGNPYKLSAFDAKGDVGIDYGVYGVPETYVIDKQGVIRYKHIGVLTPDILQDKVLPLVRTLEKEA
jgi:cytochrome c biogenesis protein CcmG, thiol:disulfide interchange protein DsbE